MRGFRELLVPLMQIVLLVDFLALELHFQVEQFVVQVAQIIVQSPVKEPREVPAQRSAIGVFVFSVEYP